MESVPCIANRAPIINDFEVIVRGKGIIVLDIIFIFFFDVFDYWVRRSEPLINRLYVSVQNAHHSERLTAHLWHAYIDNSLIQFRPILKQVILHVLAEVSIDFFPDFCVSLSEVLREQSTHQLEDLRHMLQLKLQLHDLVLDVLIDWLLKQVNNSFWDLFKHP